MRAAFRAHVMCGYYSRHTTNRVWLLALPTNHDDFTVLKSENLLSNAYISSVVHARNSEAMHKNAPWLVVFTHVSGDSQEMYTC